MQAFQEIHKYDLVHGDFCANNCAFGTEPELALPHQRYIDSTYSNDFYLFDLSTSCNATHSRCSRSEDIHMLIDTVLFLLRDGIKPDDENPLQIVKFIPTNPDDFIVCAK